jgi:hypothetical protein
MVNFTLNLLSAQLLPPKCGNNVNAPNGKLTPLSHNVAQFSKIKVRTRIARSDVVQSCRTPLHIAQLRTTNYRSTQILSSHLALNVTVELAARNYNMIQM